MTTFRKQTIYKIVFNRIMFMFLVTLFFLIYNINTSLANDFDQINITTNACVLIEADTGKVIYEKNADKIINPASVTKIMTSIIAIENANLSQEILVKKDILDGMFDDENKVGLIAGEIFSLNDLLYMSMLPSGNDAALVIADAVGENVDEFVNDMNIKARELGATNTNFMNPSGLDIGNGYTNHVTTANDFSKILRYAMSLPEYRSIVSVPEYVIHKNDNNKYERLAKSTNLFFTTINYDKSLYSITGAKTGYTNAASCTLTSSAINSDGIELICIMFGNNDRQTIYLETKLLFDYGFNMIKSGGLTFDKSFYDIRYRWSHKVIKYFIKEGFVDGYEDNSFRPTSPITKEEFIALFAKIHDEQLNQNNVYYYWSIPYLNWASENKKMDFSWYNKRQETLTRKEVFGFIAKTLEIEIKEEEYLEIANKITDFDIFDENEKESVVKLYHLNIIEGYPDGEIKLHNIITREETLAIIYSYLQNI